MTNYFRDTELFPKKVKSKFIKTRPASWEKDFEKVKIIEFIILYLKI